MSRLMTPDDLVTVYTVHSAAEAEIIKNALEADGIACSIGNESQAGLAGLLEIVVQVRATDEPRARELIAAAHEAESESES